MSDKKDNDKKNEAQVQAVVPYHVDDIPIKSAYNKYESPFMQLIAPLIATRYLWLAIEDINPKNFLKKPNPGGEVWKEPGALRYASRNFAAFGMGATFLSIMSLYSKNTLHDIRSLYAEAVGYELDKKPEDVTYKDIFKNSQNKAVEVTCKAYTHRTMIRLSTAATFFVPWHKFRDFPESKPKYDANANAGVGAVGVYLMGEGLMREPSFFDVEQGLVFKAINHTDKREIGSIKAENIQTLLMLQKKHENKGYQRPTPSSEEGQCLRQLSVRVADLMNQTYGNSTKHEQANFTLGKFNFLTGFGLLDNFPESMAYVELANRSSDMKEVKAVAAAIKGGQSADQAFKKYGISVEEASCYKPAPEAAASQQKSFQDIVGRKEPRDIKLTPKDFAMQAGANAISM